MNNQFSLINWRLHQSAFRDNILQQLAFYGMLHYRWQRLTSLWLVWLNQWWRRWTGWTDITGNITVQVLWLGTGWQRTKRRLTGRWRGWLTSWTGQPTSTAEQTTSLQADHSPSNVKFPDFLQHSYPCRTYPPQTVFSRFTHAILLLLLLAVQTYSEFCQLLILVNTCFVL